MEDVKVIDGSSADEVEEGRWRVGKEGRKNHAARALSSPLMTIKFFFTVSIQ